MKYYTQQLKRAISLRDGLCEDPGNGFYFKIPREFVLKDPKKNLHFNFRQDAIQYFSTNKIGFWHTGEPREKGSNIPSGHMLSSQVSCVNHLFGLRDNEEFATAVLKNVDKSVKRALRFNLNPNDSGFVSFEFISSKPFLNEKSHIRGAQCTSIDAAMLGELESGKVKIFLIEWKFVEQYKGKKSKLAGSSGETRKRSYLPLLEAKDCPINFKNSDNGFLRGLFFEPFYQLTRQTLLANEMVKHQDYGATEYLHLHIIPSGNLELLLHNPTKGDLPGKEIEEIWKEILKDKKRYLSLTPSNFLEPLRQFKSFQKVQEYLEKRYW